MTLETICNRVRAVVDSLVESRTDGVTLITDQENLDEVIKDKAGYGLLYILQNASSDMLDEAVTVMDASALTASDFEQQDKVWKVRLPEKTLRVLSARLSTWRQAPMPVDEGTPEALMQLDEYARGSWDRPVVILRREGSRLWLELYSGKGTETQSDIKVSYIPSPDIEGMTASTDLTVPGKVEGAFIYYVAALTMTAFRESVAQSLFSIANEQLGISAAAQSQEG